MNKSEKMMIVQRDFAALAEQVARLQIQVYALRNQIAQMIAYDQDGSHVEKDHAGLQPGK